MFQPQVCNRSRDLLVMLMYLSNIAILKNKNVNYHCITGISKSEAIKLLQNIDLTEKSETLQRNKY